MILITTTLQHKTNGLSLVIYFRCVGMGVGVGVYVSVDVY